MENVKLLPTIGDSSDPPSKVKWTDVGYMFSRWLNFPYLLMLVLALSPEAFYLFESRAESGETNCCNASLNMKAVGEMLLLIEMPTIFAQWPN